ncbi:zinc finger CCCH domain-containing protein 11A-like isoform X2 [Numida meleagris]|uniref:zinc finger CCCH domain-containing protein 11A-like isoform X2 n=1 Tax=Numida meleagris TaxID=8996 RepID=UPI000B3E347E|nr:zinc finger CCCH domain-containing protein 11A-like isoform X2 [Numida meleagris]
MANQGDGSYSRFHSAPRKIRLNHDETWGKWKAFEADRRGIPVKRSLAERLGKKGEVDKAPKSGTGAQWTSGDIRVKTLEEIRQEKADRQGRTPAQLRAAGQCKTEGRSSEAGPSLAVYRAENKTQSTLPLSVSAKVKLEEPAEKIKALEEIHIKTLEEIKREKALRLQQREESVSAPPAPPAPAPARRKLIQTPKLIAPGKEEKKNVELSTSVPEAVCAPARKHKGAEMCRCTVRPSSTDATEEPAAKTAAVAVVAAWSEDTLVTIPEAEKPPKSQRTRALLQLLYKQQQRHKSCAALGQGQRPSLQRMTWRS